jgi:activator of 2-hydroxyglutaryl-CoA dehydratase
MNGYLGIDVGSVSTNIVLIDEDGHVVETNYLRTRGQPIATVQTGLQELKRSLSSDIKIMGVGTTGSGRRLAGLIVGADAIKN